MMDEQCRDVEAINKSKYLVHKGSQGFLSGWMVVDFGEPSPNGCSKDPEEKQISPS